ncbi:MAG: hypothetical protein ACRD3J_23780 [Thermoanaerobaculia bacterium]
MAAQAAIALSSFHRVALAFGFASLIILVFRHWSKLSTLSGPVGHVIAGSFSAFAIPEALFPLFWIIVRDRPVTDISSQYLGVYIYIGASLVILISIIGFREAWKK